MPGGPRVSDEAVNRNRNTSLSRYYRNHDQARKVQHAYKERRFEERPFIGWDSEGYDYFICAPNGEIIVGPQRTMLFGCSVPERYITGIDLGSKDMFDMLLRVEAEFPDAFHVGFSFEYDINQMLKDLPWRMLAVLKLTGKVRWNGYRIKHVPHKLITISKGGITATVYDSFGFFHCKYETALKKYRIGSPEQLRIIHEGKSQRGRFTYADLPEVTRYWQTEIGLFPALMDCVRDAAYGGGYRISSWHGPGALAAYGLRYNGVRKYMSRKTPWYVKRAVRCAYAGGRFQAWQCGWYEGDVYTLDKNSAYVQAISLLPNLAKGSWRKINAANINGPADIARFGLYHIRFDARNPERSRWRRDAGVPDRPQPLFHRDKNGRLTWPDFVDGWFWSPEAKLVAGSPYSRFVEGYVFRDDGTYPFKWVNDSYDLRVHLQGGGPDSATYNPAEKAYKWALAAMYGAFARRVGWDRRNKRPPRSHELCWAGFITSHCRAAIFDVASWAASKGALISVDTDGVTGTVPFPEDIVPEGFGTGLGQWKQDHYSAILFWQNGIYWLRDVNDHNTWREAKSRGVPKGVISIQDAMGALEQASFIPPYRPATIKTVKTRYIGYRQALNSQFKRWRVWVREPNELMFGGAGKGAHLPPFCRKCKTPSWEGMHTITHIPPKDPESHEHKLPWLQDDPDDTALGEFDLGSDIFANSLEIFDDRDLEDRL